MAQALGCQTEGVVQTNNQTNGGRRPCGLCRPLRAPAHTLAPHRLGVVDVLSRAGRGLGFS